MFEVSRTANKHQIKAAVESLFGVNVTDVRTLNVRGKSKRFGRFYGKRSNWKKAYVTLADGDFLNFFGRRRGTQMGTRKFKPTTPSRRFMSVSDLRRSLHLRPGNRSQPRRPAAAVATTVVV